MATLREFARESAQKIRLAVREDDFLARFPSSAYLTKDVLRGSSLVAQFGRIHKKILELNEDDHQPAIRLIAADLGLRTPAVLESVCLLSASNDAFLELADAVWELLDALDE